jgi:hypothetical protein
VVPSSVPAGSKAMADFGMPSSRMRRVRARVSMPERPMTPRFFSQASSVSAERHEAGSVGGALKTAPRAPAAPCAELSSWSSALAPTLPMCGKVKRTICSA